MVRLCHFPSLGRWPRAPAGSPPAPTLGCRPDFPSLRLFQQFLQAGAEGGEFVAGHVPDDGVVDAEIIVDEPIMHSGEFPPFDLRLLVAYFLRSLLGRFADDLYAPNEGTA